MRRTTVASAQSPRGEMTLQRRDDDALELRVNGVFVMDTLETSSETALAALALSRLAPNRQAGKPRHTPVSILVGGLGLGYTLRALAASDRVDEIVVVEIEGALIEWHRGGLVPTTARMVDDPRLTLVEGDVREVVESAPRSAFDAIILDVDNGPGFLVYDDNAAVYQAPFVAACREALRPGGSLVVWSADEAPELADALRGAFGAVEHHAAGVTLGTRDELYHSYAAGKKPETSSTCPAP